MTNGTRVLIVDDDELVRESIAAFLEDDGFIVEVAVTAEEGLAMLKSADFNVCLTDFTLPGMDGEKFIILAREITPATGFIMHSGVFFNPSAELLKTGFTADNVMSKPIIRLEKLSERINALAGNYGKSE